MNKRKQYISMFFILGLMLGSCNSVSNVSNGQSIIVVQVKDVTTYENIEGVKVCIFSKDEIQQYSITDSSGLCYMRVPSGKFYIECSNQRYEKLVVTDVELKAEMKYYYDFKMSLLTY